MKKRLKAAGVHLGFSLIIAGLSSVLVLVLWYPYPYSEISGGRKLVAILMSMDVVLGPLLTLAVFNPLKKAKELRRDLTVIGTLQLIGLSYGLWTAFVARPVHLVFEIDRFRVVHAVEVAAEEAGDAPAGRFALPMTGPTLLAVRPLVDERERMEATLAGLQGLELSARPRFWQPYAEAHAAISKAARPASELVKRFPARAGEIEAAVIRSGRAPLGALAYLPLVGRSSFWTVIVDPATAEPVGFVALDSF
jgi:hypothetical protein